MIQQNLYFLPSYTACNISCITLMYISCIQEILFSNSKNYHINASSRKVLQRSTKLRNNPTFFTYNEKRIMRERYLTGAPSHQHLTSSMIPPSTGVPGKIPRHTKVFPIQKQEKCTQVC